MSTGVDSYEAVGNYPFGAFVYPTLTVSVYNVLSPVLTYVDDSREQNTQHHTSLPCCSRFQLNVRL